MQILTYALFIYSMIITLIAIAQNDREKIYKTQIDYIQRENIANEMIIKILKEIIQNDNR